MAKKKQTKKSKEQAEWDEINRLVGNIDTKVKKVKAKKKVAKKTTKKIREQKKLIRTIRNPERYFKFDFTRYGGEVCMGSITSAQFEHWYDNDGFEEYMAAMDYDADEANKDVPKEAQFDKPFYEYGDICHLSGPEFVDGQTLTITEQDKDGNALMDDDGNFMTDEMVDFGEFKKKGVTVECTAEHNPGSDSCKDVHYVFSQYFNKGGWYTTEPIKTGPDGIDFKKMKIAYENCDGFKGFSRIEYDGENYDLEEDSVGKSSSFYVMEGDDV